MRLESPFALLLLLLIPLLIEKNNPIKEQIKFSTAVDLALLPSSLKQSLYGIFSNSCKLIAYTMFVFALSRPQTVNSFVETEYSGKDIVLALDISGSMLAMDFELNSKRVNRLTALKKVVSEFVEKREGDRIGLVVFGDQAFTQCPLTKDSKVLINYIDALEVGMAGQATAIGDGIAIALKKIREIEADSKVILLVTDGQDTNSVLTPKTAALEAKKLQVKIHTIGIGGKGPAPLPYRDLFGRVSYRNVDLLFDDKTLKEIADVTGGKYYLAKNTHGLEEVYTEIDKLEERVDKSTEYIEYKELYLNFILIGFAVFLLREIILSTIMLRIP